MRPTRTIPAEEENSRTEPVPGTGGRIRFFRSDPVKPEPGGTIVLKAFRIAGYDSDCDGSLMARLENIDRWGDATGWNPKCIGLHPSTSLVISEREWEEAFGGRDQ